MAEVLGKMPEIVVLPLVVFPVIGTTGIMLPRRSVKILPFCVIWLQLVEPVQKLSPTLTVVT
jgi:hypothetical protein